MASESTEDLAGSIKFCNVLMCIMKNHGGKASRHKALITRILSRSSNYMAKTALKLLNTL